MPFGDVSLDTGVYVDLGVFDGAPILIVWHDEDGDWQFLAAPVADEQDDVDHVRLVHLRHLVQRDPGLEELADLPEGWWAERESPSAPWRRGEG